MSVRLVSWERTDEHRGHSLARVEGSDDGWLCHGTEVLADPHDPLSCTFSVRLDRDWTTREVEVDAVTRSQPRRLSLRAEQGGAWWRDGLRSPELDGCVDVDVAATPLTNTFPIRRLGDLPVGEQVTTLVAWVEVPSLRVLRVEQTYRRLGERRWRYSDPAHGAFELVVDEDGLVVDYEGFATRVR